MKKTVFYSAGDTDALRHGVNLLRQWGYSVAAIPTEQATHLLLPVPSMDTDGRLKGGAALEEELDMLPKEVTVLGGKLPPLPCPSVDFLKDEYYLQENAAITARCAMERIRQKRENLASASVLVIGWGRIGKQLTPLLQAAGADVAVAARKESDLLAIAALGYRAIRTGMWDAGQFDIIINTVPAPLLDQSDTKAGALLMDLASVRGISGDRVIWARGLPNQDAPEESGLLIAKTALRFALGKELL